MRRFQSAAVLGLALLAPVDGQTQEPSRDTLVVTLPAPAVSNATPDKEPVWQSPAEIKAIGGRHGLMWKASLSSNIVYLLGSIHLGSRELYPLPEHIEEAFRSSTVLVVEVDLNKLDQKKFQSLLAANGLYPREDTLWNHISANTKRLVGAFCEKHALDAEAFARMKPWLAAFATSFLPAGAGKQNFVMGIDKYFLDKAANGMQVEPLESEEYQLRLMSNMSDAEQERNLRAAVKNAGENVEDFQKLQTYWLDGDAEKLDAYVSASMRDDPEVRKRVFSDRNPRMADRAEQCLKSGDRCFVVLGAGHMVGKDGVVRLLRNKGYKVEQVFSAQ